MARSIVLVLAVLLALWGSEPPAPLTAEAPLAAFSALRAMRDVTAIAQKPHPVATAQLAEVRAYLIRRLTEMGLEPQLQSGRALSEFAGSAVSAPLSNIIATLKGKDRSLPAVLVMSHYDSVPDSPGAADDAAGVAAMLEIARAMKSEGTPARDVIFLFTDGEEIGLAGASYFFRAHPLAAQVGAVINFEARGDSGPAMMFETGDKNRDAVALWAQKAPHIRANSLSRAIYRMMPNGTDLTVAIGRGLPGLNFAFLGHEEAYHTPLSTPEALNQASLQHLGEQGLAAARAFAETMPQQQEDSVYADFLGLVFLQYSFATGWVLFGVAALLTVLAIVAALANTSFAWGHGAVAALAALFLPPFFLFAAGLLFGSTHHFLRLAHIDYLMGGGAMLSLGAAFLGASLFRKKPVALWQWLLLVNLALAGIAQALLPEAAFVFTWPVMAAAVMALIRYAVFHGKAPLLCTLLNSAIAVLFLAQAGMAAIAFFTAVGVDMPVVMAILLISVLPVLFLVPAPRETAGFALFLSAAGLGLYAYGVFAPFSAAHPAPTLIRHVTDLDALKAYRAQYIGTGDGWVKETLGEARYAPLPAKPGRAVWWSAAPLVSVPKTALLLQHEGGTLAIAVQPLPGAYAVTLSLKAVQGLKPGMLDGVKTSEIPAGKPFDLRYYAPGPQGFVLLVPAPQGGTVEATVTTLYRDWPEGAPPLAPLPPDKMAFANSATTETITRAVWKP